MVFIYYKRILSHCNLVLPFSILSDIFHLPNQSAVNVFLESIQVNLIKIAGSKKRNTSHKKKEPAQHFVYEEKALFPSDFSIKYKTKYHKIKRNKAITKKPILFKKMAAASPSTSPIKNRNNGLLTYSPLFSYLHKEKSLVSNASKFSNSFNLLIFFPSIVTVPDMQYLNL